VEIDVIELTVDAMLEFDVQEHFVSLLAKMSKTITVRDGNIFATETYLVVSTP
jgi:hypothetical protein